ncbi:Molecular chaperone IbpA, HSP20 family [Bacillus sp. OV322]|uniref:Hsp20/alpha crystallin family protein n=1 Tax=Bacillus sp. OV322 TaxID=1882764 RepID=UPI0008E45E4C|nr:Hsp20 family protein [Bacillus sp. OV322]SFC63740.1 Molecular chaperone IbpA, HSP20 family [Bacillus sp. OV322]
MENQQFDEELENDKFDEWMSRYFLDPVTSYLDMMTFRIDLYESSEEYIVEGLLEVPYMESINVIFKGDTIIVRVNKEVTGITEQTGNFLERSICFPYSIDNKKITAELENRILTITINKQLEEKNKNNILYIKSE